jgi:hypothetical protein
MATGRQQTATEWAVPRGLAAFPDALAGCHDPDASGERSLGVPWWRGVQLGCGSWNGLAESDVRLYDGGHGAVDL